MSTPKLFEYAILWHPTDKQRKDEGLKSCVVQEPVTVLASDKNVAAMIAAANIPENRKADLDQIEIVVRDF